MIAVIAINGAVISISLTSRLPAMVAGHIALWTGLCLVSPSLSTVLGLLVGCGLGVLAAFLQSHRDRAIDARQRELERVHAAVAQKGYTCVALALYWSKHLIKCEIALGKGKKEFDKRDTVRERDSNRELQRAVRNKGKED